MLFQNRTEAGEKLAQELVKLAPVDPLVLALPRGGVPVGIAVARVLHCPCDVLPLMKIPIPWNPEASYGVVVLDGTVVLNKPLVNRLELSGPELEISANRVLQEAKKRAQLYYREKSFPVLENKTVVLADDGLASGYSMLAAVTFAKKQNPRSLIVAAPIASDLASHMLTADKGIAHLVSLVRNSEQIFSLADYFREFTTLTDDDVIQLLSVSGA